MITKTESTHSYEKYTEVYHKYTSGNFLNPDKGLDERVDFQILRLEDVVVDECCEPSPARQSHYWITLVRKGWGGKKTEAGSFLTEDCTLIIAPGHTAHPNKYRTAGCSGYILSFSVDFLLNSSISMEFILNQKALKTDNRPCLKLNKVGVNATARMFEDMLKINEGEKPGGKEMLAIKILELLIYCDPLLELHNSNDGLQAAHPLVKRFTELLNKKFNQERGVQYYATALEVHPNYLNFLSKKYNGISAKESIDNKLVLESKYLLGNRSLRIKEIAYKLGFDDPNNFSTFFQKYAGRSPLMYRTSMF
jgi:AraC family transcriptional activator of pobA